MHIKSLEDVLQAAGNPVTLLRNQQTGPNVYPGIPPEYTNWRDETQAWQKTCVLFNQSYHMADLLVEGPDAQKLLSQLAVNSFAGFAVDKAKQFVPCTPDGYVIGDVILFYLAPNSFNLVGRIPSLNWIRFHAATGGYDVKVELDERSAARPDPFNRKAYRFQLQGPNAMHVLEKVIGGKAPELKFFNMGHVTIAGRPVRALRHGMAGQPGYELFGPYAEHDLIRDAIGKAGEEFGLRFVGGRAYSANTLESGWVPSPLPGIYTGEKLKAYRQWLPADCYEAKASIGGSFNSPNIEDYYLTPWDLGYGPAREVRPRFHRARGARKESAGPAPQEGDAGAQHRRRDARHRQPVPARRARQVHGVPVGGVLDAPVRQGDEERQNRRRLDPGWGYSANEGADADAGDSRARARHRRQSGHLRVGRRERRHVQADGRAPRAGGDPGHGEPGALQRGWRAPSTPISAGVRLPRASVRGGHL
jgi:syringate O-demethylase